MPLTAGVASVSGGSDGAAGLALGIGAACGLSTSAIDLGGGASRSMTTGADVDADLLGCLTGRGAGVAALGEKNPSSLRRFDDDGRAIRRALARATSPSADTFSRRLAASPRTLHEYVEEQRAIVVRPSLRELSQCSLRVHWRCPRRAQGSEGPQNVGRERAADQSAIRLAHASQQSSSFLEVTALV